jgi:pimeloyl-ACP methyl ester carboxylesterase
MYLSASEGDYSGMAFLSLFMRFQAPTFVWGDVIFKGATLDLDYYKGEESLNLGDSVLGAPMAEYLWPAVSGLPVVLDDPDLRVLHESDVDMLIVNGSLDFSTPPTAIEEAKPYWHNAKFVVLKNFGHVSDVENLQPEAYQHLVEKYYESGEVDASLFKDNVISFKPGLSLTVMAKFLLGVALTLLVVIIWLVMRRLFS